MIHMLHGALGSPSDWDDFMPLLQADGVHPVDLYDNETLGFGSFARALNAGFVPIRKKGKLPGDTISEDYELEYGHDTLEIHRDAIKSGQRVLMVDDLIATGGTLEAGVKLIKQLGGNLVGISVLIELEALDGARLVNPHEVHAVLRY